MRSPGLFCERRKEECVHIHELTNTNTHRHRHIDNTHSPSSLALLCGCTLCAALVLWQRAKSIRPRDEKARGIGSPVPFR